MKALALRNKIVPSKAVNYINVIDFGEVVGIGSKYLPQYITLDKKNYEVVIEDDEHLNDDYDIVIKNLRSLIEEDKIQHYLEGQDNLKSPKKCYRYDNGQIIESFYETGEKNVNVTIDGRNLSLFYKSLSKLIESLEFLINHYNDKITEVKQQWTELDNQKTLTIIALSKAKIMNYE
jgi:hypothetical protein